MVTEERKLWDRRYYDKHKEEISARRRVLRAAHPEEAREYSRRYRSANLERARAYHKTYYEIHKEELRARARTKYFTEDGQTKRKLYCAANQEKISAYQKIYGDAHKEERSAKRKSGIKTQREAAAGRPRPELCEVCGGTNGRTLHWDHDHKTDTFRGWLCGHCNSILGYVQENPMRLRSLALYLEHGGPEE